VVMVAVSEDQLHGGHGRLADFPLFALVNKL
jgi:hypothetical protein